MITLIDEGKLPENFRYPNSIKKAVKLNLVDLTPWYLMDSDRAYEKLLGLKERYPNRTLIPFARRDDNDDVACFELLTEEVQIIHDFATRGFEQRNAYTDFWAWFKASVDEMIQFE